MKLKTIVIDDEPIALEKLRAYAMKVPYIDLLMAFDNPISALEYLSFHQVDLIFTDIEMPDLNGMDFVAGLTSPPMVVFTTAYDNHAVDSYRLHAVDYLLKPYSFVSFQQAAGRALEQARLREAPSPEPSANLFIKTDTRYIKVDQADIYYIKGFGEYLQVYLRTQPTPLVTLSSFAAIRRHLGPEFLQIHRSYIVNLDNVRQIERSHITVADDTSLPVSDSYRAALQQYLSNRTIGGSHNQ
ncbi:MAG: LytTR family DNA-binding domain-containing protein [Paramuribaculum sp.]|nr:LytTR family DNA-binding domain-containing protein [Paramuribaculum sp.]